MYKYIKKIYKKLPFVSADEELAEEVFIDTVEQSDNKETDWLAEESLSQLAVDVYEQSDSYIIKAAVPGVKPDEIKVVIDDNKLILKINKKEESVDKNANYFYQECYWGNYVREVSLPAEVRNEDVEAILKNGVLVIKIKKLIKNGPTTVNIKTEGPFS